MGFCAVLVVDLAWANDGGVVVVKDCGDVFVGDGGSDFESGEDG